MNYINGCVAHKHFSQFVVYNEKTKHITQERVEHQNGAIHEFLNQFSEGATAALENIGNWYWIIDEIEQAVCTPMMAHAGKAKIMMGNVNKTDKLDARGLTTLLRNGTLPTVWIPLGNVGDERKLPRIRKSLCKIRVSDKNRIHATFAPYNLSFEDKEGSSEIFSKRFAAK